MSQYKSGEKPQVGDRVLGVLSGRQAVVNELIGESGNEGRDIIVTYDDETIPARQGAYSHMYELVERPASFIRQWREGAHVELFDTAYRVAGYDAARDAYSLLPLNDDGLPFHGGHERIATAEVMRQAKAIARYHVGDVVEVVGRYGTAKIIGFGETTSQSGVRYRLQWSGGQSEFLPEHELRLVAKGEQARMFKTDRNRLETLEKKVEYDREVVEAVENRVAELESSLDSVKQAVEAGESEDAALWEYARQTASEHNRTRERVGNIERREGNNAAAVNTLSSTLGNVERELRKIGDALDGAASAASVRATNARLDEIRTDLGLLAKAQLRSMGVVLHDSLDPIDGLRTASSLRRSYGDANGFNWAQGTGEPSSGYNAAGTQDQSRAATPVSLVVLAKALQRIKNLEDRCKSLEGFDTEVAAAVWDDDGESYFGGLVDRVEELEAMRLPFMPVGAGRQAVADASIFESRITRLEALQAQDRELVSQLRAQAAEIIELHPALGERLQSLERRFNQSQARARKLASGPLSFKKRIAALEEAVANMIRGYGERGELVSGSAVGLVERLTRLESIEANRASYIALKTRRGEDYETRLGRIEGALNDRSGHSTVFAAWDSLNKNVVDHEHAIGRLQEAFATLRGVARGGFGAAGETYVELSKKVETLQESVNRQLDRLATMPSGAFVFGKFEELEKAIDYLRGKLVVGPFVITEMTEETQEDGSVLIDVVFCEPSVESAFNPAWECLEKHRQDRAAKKHAEQDAVTDAPLVETPTPYPGWQACGIPDCTVCRVNREYRASLERGTFEEGV